MSFQTQVNVMPAIGVAGDFAGHNPRVSVLAGPGGLVAGPQGVTVGRFAWLNSLYIDPDNASTVINSFGNGSVGGFVGRPGADGLNTIYLSDASMLIPQGFRVPLFSGGDFLAKNEGSGYAQQGMTAYAALSNGALSFASGASAASTVSAATSTVTAQTSSFTGSIIGNTMIVTSVASGTIYPGTTISGTGVSSGNQVVAQISGTPGGVGAYAVSIGEQAVAAGTSISGAYGLLTLGAAPSGQFQIGGLLSGTGVAAGTYITAYVSGSGSASGNTLVVNNNTAVSSATLSATTTVATKFVAMSAGAAGELIKISSWQLG